MPTAVLLATLNGAEFLREQLASLSAQTIPSLDIMAADDQSTDGTLEMLRRAAGDWSKGSFRLIQGARAGSATANFRNLIVSLEGDYDFVAFCDQDDIWLPNKLEQAIAEIADDPAVPQVRCARTELIDAQGRTIGLSPYFRRPPEFRNALVQSLAGGNTMVMNRRAFELVRAASHRARFVGHDWWVYQIVTGAGGRIVYSPVPDTRYRQHGGNDIGANVGVRARAVRVAALFRGRFRQWNDLNLKALDACRDLLTAEALQVLGDFSAARRGTLWHRLRSLRKSRVFRQTTASQISLYLACLLRLM